MPAWLFWSLVTAAAVFATGTVMVLFGPGCT